MRMKGYCGLQFRRLWFMTHCHPRFGPVVRQKIESEELVAGTRYVMSQSKGGRGRDHGTGLLSGCPEYPKYPPSCTPAGFHHTSVVTPEGPTPQHLNCSSRRQHTENTREVLYKHKTNATGYSIQKE